MTKEPHKVDFRNLTQSIYETLSLDGTDGYTYAKNHCVISTDGKIIGIYGTPSYILTDGSEDGVYDWNDGKTQIGWVKNKTNLAYKDKYDDGTYHDMLGTIGNFWDALTNKLNAKFTISTDDLANFLTNKNTIKALGETIKDMSKSDKNLASLTNFIIGEVDKLDKFTKQELNKFVKEGVKRYNKEHPNKQIIYKNDRISIEDILISFCSYFVAVCELLIFIIIVVAIEKTKKQRKEEQEDGDNDTYNDIDNLTINKMLINNKAKQLDLIF